VLWKESRITRLEVRAEGRLEQWVDYGYTNVGCLATVTDVLGHADEYEYDRFHRMTTAVIKTGVRFQYEYEENSGRCVKTWGPKGLYAIELRADAAAHTTYVEGEEPRVVTWNDEGLPLREGLPDGTLIEEHAYDDDGLIIARVNGAGEGVQHWYDSRGNRVRTVDAGGNVTAWEYGEDDLPTRRVGPDGSEQRYGYDGGGGLASIADSAGPSYVFSRDAAGRVTAVSVGDQPLWALEYDRQHNVVAETDARGARTVYAYDAMGRPVARTCALGRTTRVTYDRLGRRIALRFPDGTSRQCAYDALGKIVREVDGLGQVTSLEYGGMGVLTRVVPPDGKAWTFAYTGRERLREIKSPAGESYRFTYDEAGRIVHEETFDRRVIAYRYDAAGRVAEMTYPDGSRRAFVYDRLGGLLADDSADGRLSFQRDRLGRLIGAVIDDGADPIVTRFERDALGRVVAEHQGDRALRYGYDLLGRRTSRVMPDGATTRYTYDAAGALSALDHAGHRIVLERDAMGRETKRSEEQGRVVVTTAYDGMDRMIEQRAVAPAAADGVPAVLVQRQWQYDAMGRVTRIDDARWGATSFRYDSVGQLLEAKGAGHREAFVYDARRALVQQLAELGGRAPDEGWELGLGGQVKRTARAKYTYDARGRRAVKLELGPGDAAGGPRATEYAWDSRDKLREVRLPDGARVTFRYDALGRRVEKTISPSPAQAARVVTFLWDGDALAGDVDSERGARCFVHRPNTLIPLLQAERGEVFLYVTDQVGTAKELLDSAGGVAWAASHSAWGSVVSVYATPASEAGRGRAVTSPFRLLGQVADEETGLCCTRFRYFDPEIGRFCGPDPLGIGGGKNLFAFNGSPTNTVDPLGLSGPAHGTPVTPELAQHRPAPGRAVGPPHGRRRHPADARADPGRGGRTGRCLRVHPRSDDRLRDASAVHPRRDHDRHAEPAGDEVRPAWTSSLSPSPTTSSPRRRR
jgi:RHS repeat-associated protein